MSPTPTSRGALLRRHPSCCRRPRGTARPHEDGFEIFCAPDDAAPIWTTLTDTGADHGLVPAGLACRDTLRLEAGMPLYGHELSAHLTPYAAGLGRVVKLDKQADFIGKDALAARSTSKETRKLVGLIPTGRRAPRAGYAVRRIHDRRNHQRGPSPTLGHPIAMAYLDPAHATVGAQVHVDVRGTAEPPDVVALPFYRRSR